MDQLLPFIVNHWVLSAALVLVLIILAIEEGRSKGSGAGKVGPEAAVNLINREDAAIIDVRSEQKFHEGHLVGSVNIASADIAANLNKLKKYKNKPVIVVCDRGVAAAKAASHLRREGFESALVLTGGIEAWKAAKLPLSKKK